MSKSENLFEFYAENEQEMVEFGHKLGQACKSGAVVFFNGDLGVGKTTLARGVLRSFGHQGSVKSPTYTLVEPYETDLGRVFHFDLYRLADPEELEYLGIRDYFDPTALCLIEWPECGQGVLPAPDLQFNITVSGSGRMLVVHAGTERGERLLEALSSQ